VPILKYPAGFCPVTARKVVYDLPGEGYDLPGGGVKITRFDRIHERDRHTDRRTPHDGIAPVYAYHRAEMLVFELEMRLSIAVGG